jgi:hypothetical protein
VRDGTKWFRTAEKVGTNRCNPDHDRNPYIIRSRFRLANQDGFGRWLEDTCDVELGSTLMAWPNPTLFASWDAYATKAGYTAGSMTRFSETMQARGLHFPIAASDFENGRDKRGKSTFGYIPTLSRRGVERLRQVRMC